MNYKIGIPILFAALLASSMTIYAGEFFQYNPTKKERAHIKDIIRDNLRDPDSLIIRSEVNNVRNTTHSSATLKSCWYIAAKNAYGGYGETQMVYVVSYGERISPIIVFGDRAEAACETRMN